MTTLATYFGEPPDLGRVVIGEPVHGEGYAVIRCGNTELVIGYDLLHHMRLQVDKDSPVLGDLLMLQSGLDSITCEASLGRNGDQLPGEAGPALLGKPRPALY